MHKNVTIVTKDTDVRIWDVQMAEMWVDDV